METTVLFEGFMGANMGIHPPILSGNQPVTLIDAWLIKGLDYISIYQMFIMCLFAFLFEP